MATSTWRKVILTVTAVLILVCFTVVAVTYVSYNKIKINNAPAEHFSRELIRAVGEQSVLDMREMTLFEWDKLIVFYPYTSKDEIERIVGREWTTYSYAGYWLVQKSVLGKYPLDDDVWNRLVFMNDGQVVLDVTFNRRDVDVTKLEQVIARDSARFNVNDRMLLPMEN